jgi:hypothetical protein
MMNDIKIIMKFEQLPNEILIECFDYLSAVHIFHSFDQLNYRFNELIYSIPLHLDFQHIYQKLICDQFCTKLLLNPNIKTHIYSLCLSNLNTCNNIQSFLSIFSLDEFSHLRSLTFNEIRRDDVSQLTSMLPLLPHLSCFRLINAVKNSSEIISELPTSQLRTLILPQITSELKLMYEYSPIVNLTIYKCDFDDLCQILYNAPLLKYLKVRIVYVDSYSKMRKSSYSTIPHATDLRQLILMYFDGEFFDLEVLLKQTPKLESLTINASSDNGLIDAYRWEDLITSSLPHLNIFKFHLEYVWKDKDDGISQETLEQFRSDFWHKKHHWYTEYSSSEYSALIYTLPYLFDTYELKSDTIRYSNELVNNSNAFDSVRNLTIYSDAIRETCQYHFSRVTSMTLVEPLIFSDETLLKIKDIKMIVNLFNLKHLTISSRCNLDTPLILTGILIAAPQLSSLDINMDTLISLFDDDELCNYLNKMIIKLHIRNYFDFYPCYQKQFFQIFSNIEQLTIKTQERDCLFSLLKHLSKLTLIAIRSRTCIFTLHIDTLEEDVQKLGISIITDFYYDNDPNLSIWIIRHMHHQNFC